MSPVLQQERKEEGLRQCQHQLCANARSSRKITPFDRNRDTGSLTCDEPGTWLCMDVVLAAAAAAALSSATSSSESLSSSTCNEEETDFM